ncbi:MAG: DNA polymerase/3'-5' exonuclease PolX [Alphaproteobacteria bacterium]|nr:MAG: DNA polymerase/3'-5' exonuclease PolX [Alphaproteobacteria bacterium]
MPNLTAAEISKLLRELALRLELEGGNPYRARAYSRAADNLALSPVSVDQLIAEGRLKEIPGIGDALAAVITKIYETGHHPSLAAMREHIPESVLEMLRIPGLKADRIRKLHTELGISSLPELEEAARTDKLKALKGYGLAFQTKVLQGIEMSRRPQGRHIHRAAAAINYARNEVARVHPDWTNVTPAGEIRRGCELVSELSIVAVDPHLHEDTKTTKQGELTVHIASGERYGIALLLATGSDQHIDALRTLAQKKGMTLSANGLRKKGRVVAQQTEEDIYAALGLAFIPPELRETGQEVELGLKGKLPVLVKQEDLHGVLHAHTTESDGADMLKDMADATCQRGYSYLGLTDHSQTAHYAGGLKADEVAAQQIEIERINKRLGAKFHIFKGIESDILGDGSLDYPDDILSTFDLVIASVHSKFRMERKEQTDRIVKAIENPYTTILGHVTGRQLLRRPGYEVDMERILRACAKQGVAIEINANPWRLDMDWRWCRRALELGCLFSIDPDAHSTEEIDNIQWGVLMARKGGVPKERVLNALDLAQFREHLEARKERCKTTSKRQVTESNRLEGNELVR